MRRTEMQPVAVDGADMAASDACHGCWHCGEPLPATLSFTRASRGSRVRCAVTVAVPPLNGSNSSALATTTVCARSRRRSPTRNTTSGSRDAWQRSGARPTCDTRSRRRLSRDDAAGRRRALRGLRVVDRARACARCPAWSASRSMQPRSVRESPGATRRLRCRKSWSVSRGPAIAHTRSMQQRSTMCVGASHATRSSGCWSRGSARCRP